jgi:histidine ammonia-lyase
MNKIKNRLDGSSVTSAKSIHIGLDRLTAEDVANVARHQAHVEPLDEETIARLKKSADWVNETVEAVEQNSSNSKARAYYGINTGFGALAGRCALDSRHLTEVLGRNLLASHSVGVGPWFDLPEVRAAMLIRAQSLACGFSGVRPLVVERLVAMIQANVYPAVPQQGSLGASGDLAPHAHLVLLLSEPPEPGPENCNLNLDCTDGEAFVPAVSNPDGSEGNAHYHLTEDRVGGKQKLWRRVSGAEAMAGIGGKLILGAKEALALCNGCSFSAAIAALVIVDAQNLLEHANLALAMTLEAVRGFRDPFFAEVHRARHHMAAEQVGSAVLSYIKGSSMLDAGDRHIDPVRVPPQDPYSLRCGPQVHGAIADTLELARRWIENEINAATDNPLIFLDLERSYKTISGGNFHGEPVAFAMDFLGIALTELGNISDRRMFTLTNHGQNQKGDTAGQINSCSLPQFLVQEKSHQQGLNSGLMMLQATAAALVSDCKVLAHPDSVDSIPSSGNQEDHVSMSLNAARHARAIVQNIETVLALEFICAAQAIDLQLAFAKDRGETLRLGDGTAAAYATIRKAGIKKLDQDRVLYPDIRIACDLLRSKAMLEAAQHATRAVTPC